jgi:branched-chain amino acid transport system substrate-binding protein
MTAYARVSDTELGPETITGPPTRSHSSLQQLPEQPQAKERKVAINRRLTYLIPITVVASMALAACGSSGTSSSGSASSPASNTPIDVLTVGPFTSTSTINYGEQRLAAQAAVKYINATGGIKGHPLKLTTCDDMFSPTQAVSCYAQAIGNKSIVADVGGFNINADAIQSTVEAAKFPIVGDIPTATAAYTSPMWFPFSSGNLNQYYGAGVQVVGKGAKKIGFLTVNTSGISTLIDSAVQGAKANGGQSVGTAQVSLTTVSMGPAVAELLAKKPQGIVFALTNPQTFSAIQLLRQQGFKGPIMVQTSLSTPATVVKLFGNEKNVFGFQSLPPVTATTVPGIKTFVDEMDKYAPGAPQDELSLSTWVGFMGFKQIVAKISGPITRQSVVAQLNKTTTLNLDGVIPNSVVYWGGGAPPNTSSPRVRNAYSTWTSVSNGKFTWDGLFHGDAGAPQKTASP